ncbi:methionine synthase [Oxobacter pfennigii]|uniref:Methionine synthase n=1 Tax=Oxobacter pfennigii TaxID=36849 RepID=A0A0P9ABM9_9CLOT|nr:cobalamin-dependent protein [Oxobacter pfennigii]KPU42483.1 methionine synthase [Oxobacter pfennigii]
MKDLIISAVEELNEEKVYKLVEVALDNGLSIKEIIDSVKTGMDRVGKLYEEKSYYIADLIMAGIIFKEILKMKNMQPEKDDNENTIGTIVIGTAKGDLHDIGKYIFSGIAKSENLKVIDLGTDVSSEQFISAIKKYNPDIVGISAILTLAINSMKNIIDSIESSGLRNGLKIIIGGCSVSKEVCRFVGADAYTKDASDGMKTCLKWIAEKSEEKNE